MVNEDGTEDDLELPHNAKLSSTLPTASKPMTEKKYHHLSSSEKREHKGGMRLEEIDEEKSSDMKNSSNQ